jgi:bifunctional DNA-binding transcriptional regulator/antitoxin component of YhaV-PrlF toxin-antitoxin module
MARRSMEEHNVRKLTKVGTGSYAVTIPIELVRELGWKEKQKLVVKRSGLKIIVEDWS